MLSCKNVVKTDWRLQITLGHIFSLKCEPVCACENQRLSNKNIVWENMKV